MYKINLNTLLIILVILFIGFKQFQEKINSIVPIETIRVKKQNQYFNYNTQRVEPFIRIGVLYKENSNIILPLYGRRTYVRSSTWNYYTVTNDDSRIQIELEIKDRECLRKTGCKELYSGDTVMIPEYNGVFTVKIYI